MEFDEKKVLHLTLLVNEVEKRIFYRMDAKGDRSPFDYNRNADFAGISPLRMIFPDYIDHLYLKAIVSNVFTPIPYTVDDLWGAVCDKANLFSISQKRLELAKTYVRVNDFKKNNVRSFVFWGLVTAIVVQENYEENVSLVLDFARVFEMKEDEISDICQVAKAFFGEEDSSYVFLNKEVASLFSGVWNFLKKSY